MQALINHVRLGGSVMRNYQVSDTVGFVVIPEKTSATVIASSALLLEPAASGYFMAKTATGWRRLVVVEPIKGPGTAG
jgi:hypothetical protein